MSEKVVPLSILNYYLNLWTTNKYLNKETQGKWKKKTKMKEKNTKIYQSRLLSWRGDGIVVMA